MKYNFDLIVIGGGHAGIEATMIAAEMGCTVALISMDKRAIGRLSCNPSIGGSAKGHLVKEIDSLGGIMPFIADRSGIQFKMLNMSKGPAIWSPRSQNDKNLYPYFAQFLLNKHPNICLINAQAHEILFEGQRVYGVRCGENRLTCHSLILCGGTFLNGTMYTGRQITQGGRVGEKAAIGISDKLSEFGFEKGRLKTGTPPRIYADSVEYSKTEIECGDESPQPFSYRSSSVRNQIVCYSTHTNRQTHSILESGFNDSPMFTGLITGKGPRYCPSIEDKIYRFNERESHQIMLEPEALQADTLYVNGFSTSLPAEVQEQALRTISGLENIRIQKYGYAVEYDFFYPYQLKYTLETRLVENLYFAGQINGTSGYEEAASQGLIAGINAAAKIKNLPELIIKRSDGYIGVMIDDLVNKSTDEPYRIFTSLAEYRLLLRQDNAFERLAPYADIYGLHGEKAQLTRNRIALKNRLQSIAQTAKISPASANPILESKAERSISESETIAQLCRRPALHLKDFVPIHPELNTWKNPEYRNEVNIADIEIKYEGYIKRHLAEIAKVKELEDKIIPQGYDYNRLGSLSKESREKLQRIKPASIGQASRIPGVSPTDISLLVLDLKR
jgi:tRNA uridine 5-carboxymethylaminomethyl modification enzyme